MFLLDFAVSALMDDLMEWIYGCLIAFLNIFFMKINYMGTELFQTVYAKAVILLFTKLGWVLFGIGTLVSVFECALAYEAGRGNVRNAALNVIKGFLAASLFHIVPVRLYSAAVLWQGMMGTNLAGMKNTGDMGSNAIALAGSLMGGGNGEAVFGIFLIIAVGYSIIKVFFANIKRGGILLVQIAVGSLYMFSVPRGAGDGFRQWCRQVIGICLTAFLQSLLLVIGLRIFYDSMMLGVGVMLAATEVPRICGQFGLDTGMRVNVMGGVHAATTAINMAKMVAVA